MTTDAPTIGTLSERGLYLNYLDTTTGERGAGWFSLDKLCKLGYGNRHIDDGLVVNVETVKLGRVTG